MVFIEEVAPLLGYDVYMQTKLQSYVFSINSSFVDSFENQSYES